MEEPNNLRYFFPGKLFNQTNDFTRFRLTTGIQLGEDEFAIYADLKTATAGGDQRDGLDLRFKTLQQFSCQANGPVSIASNGAVNNLDLHYNNQLLGIELWLFRF